MSGNNHENDPDRLDEVLAEYMMRIDRGKACDREVFIAENPEVAEGLPPGTRILSLRRVGQVITLAADEVYGGGQTRDREIAQFVVPVSNTYTAIRMITTAPGICLEHHQLGCCAAELRVGL